MKVLCHTLIILFLTAVSLGATDGLSSGYDFKIRYRMINAGHANLRYVVNDDTVHSEMNMNSSTWLSNLWTLADSISNRFLLSSKRLLFHEKSVNQGKYHRHYTAIFDYEDSVLVNGERLAISAPPMDLPLLIHHLRSAAFQQGDTLHFTVWDSDDLGLLSLKVEEHLHRSPLHPLQPEELLMLTPLQSTSKSRKHGLTMRLFLAADPPHDPVKIEIRTRYGDVEMIRE